MKHNKKIRNNINEDVWFTKNDIVKVPRTTFYRNQDKKFTFNAGLLVNIMCDEVLPGDSMELKMNSVIRFASPLIRPVMDDVIFEAWAFFVPTRLLDPNWESIIGNYKEDPDWTTDVNLICPTLVIPKETGFSVQSVGDYFGLPTQTNIPDAPVAGVLWTPFLGYTRIWDDYFRDENLQKTITPVLEKGRQYTVLGSTSVDDYMTTAVLGGALCPLNKRHDLFSSSLVAPLKGESPSLSLGQSAPVIGRIDIPGQLVYAYPDSGEGHLYQKMIYNRDGVNEAYDLFTGSTVDNLIMHMEDSNEPHHVMDSGLSSGDRRTYTFRTNDASASIGKGAYADLSNVQGVSVNDLRILVQTQRLKEQDARYGSRYNEYLLGSWGVVSGDARLQRPEFLGKVSFNLNVNQTVQSSGTTQESAQSNVSAYSLTGNSKVICNKSFVEHGYLYVVGGVRIKNRTYNQRIDKMWKKFTRLDYYNPVFANLGEQPVHSYEIHVNGNSDNDQVFGYQEAWYEYRYLPNQVCGYMRPGIKESLSVWNYADDYSEIPTLSPEWIQEDTNAIDRTLAIPAATGANFIADIFFENKATRPMPLHSVPGLIDHSGKIII